MPSASATPWQPPWGSHAPTRAETGGAFPRFLCMEHKPKQPAEHETQPDKIGHLKQGVPPEAASEEPTGYPTSDRHKTETNPTKP
jgi:hypothetical protein